MSAYWKPPLPPSMLQVLGENLLKNLPIVTVAGVINTQKGPIVGMFHQYANYTQGKTIHSSNQIRDFGLTVNDVPRSSGGKQSIVSKDGYHIPLAVREGLCYMDMRPPTDEELDSLPQLIFTADEPWTPNKIDSEPDDELAFFDADNDDEEHGDIFGL